ncbi:MAG: hypothetical protein ACI865_000275 [Flavobacteriaceae bacterium]|jgi:hypothetical protein
MATRGRLNRERLRVICFEKLTSKKKTEIVMKKVTYKKGAALILLAVGGFMIYVGFRIDTLAPLISGGLLTLLGVLYLFNPAAVYDDEKVIIKNPLGITVKTIVLGKDELTVDAKSRTVHIYGKKLPIPPMMVVKTELDALIELIKLKNS